MSSPQSPLPVRVLFVEDSAEDVERLVSILTRGGFQPSWTRVETGEAFIKAVETAAWDLILSAFSMTRFTTRQALAALAERDLDIPLLVVSGSIDEETAVGLMKAGARDYVLKDNLARLVPAITRELREAIARHEGREVHRVLRQNESFFRTVVEHASDIVAVVDRGGAILHVGPSIGRVLGLQPEQLIDTDFVDLIVPASREAAAWTLHDVVPGAPAVFEAEFLHADGTPRVLESIASRFSTPAGGQAIAVNARDVTERRQQERSLRETGTRLALLNAVARGAGFGASEDEIVRRALEQMAATFPAFHTAYSVADQNGFLVIGRSIGPPDGVRLEGRSVDLSRAPEVRGLLESGQTVAVSDTHADRLVGPLGRETLAINARATAGAPILEAGRLKACLSLVSRGAHEWSEHEITTLTEVAGSLSLALNEEAAQRDRRRAEDALRESESRQRQGQKMEAIGRLAGGIAHDFNNLLTAIIGYGEIAIEQIGAHPASKDVEQILIAGRRAAKLTRQLLTFSRQQMIEPEVLSPNEVVDEMAQLIGRLLGDEITLRIDLDPDIGEITVDRGQLEQVLMNLAVNARDAMPDSGTLRIDTRAVVLDEHAAAAAAVAPGPYARVVCADTGVGMDRATLARVFEPFFTTKQKGAGTGFGLATVYGIVSQSGGGVTVESEPGAGTAFTLYFPAFDGEMDDGIIASMRSQPCTVLMLEPDAVVRTLARKVLARAGHALLEAAALDVAVKLAGTSTIDVLLIGHDAEEATLALADAIRVRSAHLRVAFIPNRPFTPAMLRARVEGQEAEV
ncbi:MAG: ATP-binding protein [Acidobacteriota bacterium]|nr:ATP-binding protein [Acidobacteriota bacterium]